jgi:hypothetical protein
LFVHVHCEQQLALRCCQAGTVRQLQRLSGTKEALTVFGVDVHCYQLPSAHAVALSITVADADLVITALLAAFWNPAGHMAAAK